MRGTQGVDRSIAAVAGDIRESRIMFMAPGSLDIEVLKSLYTTVARAGVRSFEVLRRGVSQRELAQKLRALAELRDQQMECRLLHLGVGTVKREEHLEFLVGPKPIVDFVVGPYYSEAVHKKLRQRVLYIPGVDNGQTLAQVESQGLHLWKWFPAAELGPQILKAWKSIVDPETFVIATGGLTIADGDSASNLASWAPYGGAGIGSQFIKNGMVENQDWEGIHAAVKAAVESFKRIELVFSK